MAKELFKVQAEDIATLKSVHEKMVVAVFAMEDGLLKVDDKIYELIDNIETLMMDCGYDGAVADAETLERIRNINKNETVLAYSRIANDLIALAVKTGIF